MSSEVDGEAIERKEFAEKLKVLEPGSLEQLVKELTGELITATQVFESARMRRQKVKWKLDLAANQLKRDTKTARTTRHVVEHYDDRFVWYRLSSMFKQGLYPAKDPECPWRLVSSVHGFSTDQVSFHLHHDNSDVAVSIACRAQDLGIPEVNLHHLRHINTPKFHTAVCLVRMGMRLEYVIAKLKRLRNRNTKGSRGRQIYRPVTVHESFWMARAADETAIENFPEVFDVAAGKQRFISAVLQDPTLYPDCRPI